MSKQEGNRTGGSPDLDGFERLETVVDSALRRMEELRYELRETSARAVDLEEQLKRYSGGEEDPGEVLSRLRRLETENGLLTERLRKGREGVLRLLARIRFLEEQG